VKLKPGRKIRRRGWERLRIVPLCAGSEGLFSAYQIYVSPSCMKLSPFEC
jgi:hypothetical protein